MAAMVATNEKTDGFTTNRVDLCRSMTTKDKYEYFGNQILVGSILAKIAAIIEKATHGHQPYNFYTHCRPDYSSRSY
jgi:hypothetical protein